MKFSLSKVSKFTKNITTIMTGSVLAQALSFLLAPPILTRIYSPSEFGSIAAFTAVQTILAVCSNLYYSQAVMIEKEEKSAKSVVVISIYASLLVSSLTGVACIVYASIVGRSELTSLFLWLLPLETLLTGVAVSARVWNNRVQKYKQISTVSVIYSFSQSFFSIVLGLLGMGAKGLLIGKLIAILINALLLCIVMIKFTSYKQHVSTRHDEKKLAIRHKAYPLYNMPSQLLNTASEQVPIVLFSSFYGDFLTGGYSKASSLTKLPLGVVGNAFGLVFYQEASRINNGSNHVELRKFTLSTYRKLLIACIPPLFALSGFGDVLFSFVLGKPWYDAGVYASILSPWFMLTFITSPLSTILYIKEKHVQNMIINITLFASRIGVVLFGAAIGFAFTDTLIVMSVTGSIIWSVLNSYMLKLAGVRYRESVIPAVTVVSLTIIIAKVIRYGIESIM